MGVRFPELTISNPTVPTPADLESGMWCPDGYEPDESAVTKLIAGQSAIAAFAAMDTRYTWLENGQQLLVALTGPHSNEPTAEIYTKLDELFPAFAAATKERPRRVLYEGNARQEALLLCDEPESLIREHSYTVYLQKLAYDHNIVAQSTEPTGHTDILAVTRLWPELARAAKTYLIARVIPQIYRRQAYRWTAEKIAELEEVYRSEPEAEQIVDRIIRQPTLEPLPTYLMKYARHQLRTMDRTTYHRLFSPDPIKGAGSAASTAQHLRTEHDIPTTTEQLCYEASDQALDQLFRCTNSPVFSTGIQSTEALCDLQKVSVLVNRLRDRRIATCLAQAALQGDSVFWMSGPLHFEVNLRNLENMFNGRHSAWDATAITNYIRVENIS